MSRLPLSVRATIRALAPRRRVDDLLGDFTELHAECAGETGSGRAAWITFWNALTVSAALRLEDWKDRTDMGNWLTWLDVKLAFRLLRKRPLLELTSLFSLAVGIAVAVMGVTVLDSVAYSDLPWSGGERFLRVDTVDENGRRALMELDRYHLLADEADTLDLLTAKVHTRFAVAHRGSAVDLVVGARLDPRVFPFLPVRPLLGRVFTSEDGDVGAPAVALIHESLWATRYGRSSDVMSQTLEIAGQHHEIVGVLPEDFAFPNSPSVWLPLDHRFVGGDEHGMHERVEIFAVRSPHASTASVHEQLAALSHRFEEASGAEVLSLGVDRYTRPPDMGETWAMMGVMLTALVLVLVVIAANVGNLFLVRTSARTAELAVRSALGAGRGRLVAQLMAEIALMVLAATLLGFAGAHAILARLLEHLDEVPFWLDFTPSPRTVVATAIWALVATLAAGLGPALGATRRRVELDSAGRGAGRGAGLRTGRLASALTVAQLAVSVACVGAALVAARGAAGYLQPRLDVPTESILTAQVGLPAVAPDAAHGLEARRAELVRTLGELPGVQDVGIAGSLPGESTDTVLVRRPGEDASDGVVRVATVEVAPGFLRALGAMPVQGRYFTDSDLAPGALPVAVVNRDLAETYFAGRSPLGQRLRLPSSDGVETELEIVGVAPDLAMNPADPSLAAGFYVPMPPSRWLNLAVRVEGDPASYAGALRKAAAALDPEIRMIRVQPLAHVAREEATSLALFGGGLAGLGLTALALSLVGLFAVTSLSVSRRTREIGIRVALGATRSEISSLVTRQAVFQLGLGSLLGALLGFGVLRTVQSLEHGLASGTPWELGGVALALAAAGLLACWIPVRKALQVDPARALSDE